MQNRFGQLQLLFELASAVGRAQEPSEIYRAAVQGLVRAVGADRAGVLIFDPDDVLRFKAWVGLSDEYRAAVEGHTPWQRGSPDAQPIAVPDVLQEPALSVYRGVFAKEGIRAVAFIPLLGKSGLIGKFMLYHNQQHDFHPEELQVAQTIATHVAFAAERQHAEAALRASEERFRATFSQAAVGIAQIGLDGKYLLLNDRYCETLGYTQAELLEKTFMDVTHPDDHEAAESVVRQFLAGEFSSRSKEKRYVRKDGAIVWVRLAASLVRGQDGVPLYFISVVEDVTDRVQAERALRDSERSLALAQSAAHLGAWDCDVRANQTTISAEYARLHGLSPDHPPLTHEEWLGLVHPADRERVRALLRESLEQTHVWNAEFRVVWPDGSIHWLLGNGKVYLDDSGQPIRMAGVSLDITERKQAEAALLESEERFRNMADTAPVMIWVAGPDKVINFFNKTWLGFVGRTLEQELDNGWVQSVHPDDLNRCFASYSSSFDARETFHIEYRLRRADGEYRWVLCSGVPRFAPGGVFAGYIGSDIDVTDLRRAQEEDFERQKLESLGVLTRGIAHDFNNLLGGILASAELALAERAEGSPQEEELLTIRTAAIRGGEIVRQLLTYGGEESPAFEPVDLSLLVGEMLQLLKVSISKHAILATELGEGLPAVHANPAQIRQVVMNLVTNASEAIGERDGVIRVTTAQVRVGLDGRVTGAANLPAGDYLKLEVSDTGTGMTPEVQTRIFDPFFTTKFIGRGLGLAAVQGIVRGHVGAINVVSSLGQGTRFEVLLPCTNQPARDFRDIAAPASAEEVESVTGTVLVVEDEDALRQSVSKMLRKGGFSVVEASEGRAGVDLFRANERDIDVVLLDLTLPGMTGREVLEELRRMRPDVKVIITTAYSQDSVLKAIGGQQPWLYIQKPYRLSEVMELVRNVRLHTLSGGHAAG